MRLKARNLNWQAGRPVVVLGDTIAKALNVHVNERVSLRFNRKKIYAVVDLFPSLVEENQIGLSKELSSLLGNKSNDLIDVGTEDSFSGAAIIRKKLNKEELSLEELTKLIKEISLNNLTEAEVAFFVSAEKLNGMTLQETIYLTDAMVKSGKQLSFGNEIIADKHCIGGIAGNRTTPLVVSICACAGLKMPKSSSRAITSASGTADVVETIANVELSLDEIKKVVEKTNACLVWGGALGLSPSDDKIIRVERLLNLDVEPQLLASILSKKIAAGSNHILIDIPYGGGKIKKLSDAKKLGKKFEKIAKHFNIKVLPVYTKGDVPIGRGFGPILEMKDLLDVFQNKENCSIDLKEKSIYLASQLMTLCGVKNSKEYARKILESGLAYEKFKEIINAQNKSKDFDIRISNLKLAKLKRVFCSPCSGKIVGIDNHKINSLCRILGTPETISAGVLLHKNLEEVNKGDALLTLYSESEQRLTDGLKYIEEYNPIEIL